MKLITGMHRSGTSLVAQLFLEAGADMGDPSTFYPGDKWNPDGYFEQPEIHAVNMPLINGMLWKFAYFLLPSPQAISRRAGGMGDQIRATSAAYEGRTVKENRFCLTLAAWREQGARFERVIVCLREPFSVARSLQRRNWVTLAHGYRLWRIHLERLLDAAQDLPLWYVHYADLLHPDRGPSELRGALRFFGLPLEDPDLNRVWSACVKPTFNHTVRAEDGYPDDVRRLWDELMRRHAQQSAPTEIVEEAT